jgi:hypothetical protein
VLFVAIGVEKRPIDECSQTRGTEASVALDSVPLLGVSFAKTSATLLSAIIATGS